MTGATTARDPTQATNAQATTGDAAGAAPGLAAAGPGGSGPAAAGPGGSGPAASAGRRRWGAPLALAAVVLLGGVLIILLRPSLSTRGYLDPGNTGGQGTHALAALLAGRGQPVLRVTSVPAARAALTGRAATLVVTSPYLLTPGQRRTLARLPDDLLVVEPDSAVLGALGGRITVAGATPAVTAAPDCGLAAARAAGPARMGGVLLLARGPGASRCYPVDGHPSLIRYTAGGRTVTLLGSGAPLTNRYLASGGDAALTLNLLRGPPRVVWLVPGLPPAVATGPKSLFQEIPGPAYLVTLQLFIAVALTALWRARRFGPLVAEPLPVVIRASETVEGHGRLYRSRRSRGRAAAVLRAAARSRISTALALPSDLEPDAICAALAGRTGRDRAEIRAVLFGPDPRDDAALVALGRDIDRLEGEVRTP